MGQACFDLKGSMTALTVLDLSSYDPDQFVTQLEKTTAQAPNFFRSVPVIISLEKLESDDIPMDSLLSQCRAHGIEPLAFRGGEQWRSMVEKTGLCLLHPSTPKKTDSESADKKDQKSNDSTLVKEEATDKDRVSSEPSEQAVEAVDKVDVDKVNLDVEVTPVESPSNNSLIIRHPVRSGQQIYASGRDLIVLSSVSQGAELLADGCIHVYGALRGRALAGVSGDTQARVFCRSLEAEIVSVAGVFMLAEDLQKKLWRQSVQAYLEDGNLRVTIL